MKSVEKRGNFGCFLPVTCVKIKPVWPPERRRGAGAGRVLPLRLAEQAVGLACDLRQPRGIGAGIVPIDANHRVIVGAQS